MSYKQKKFLVLAGITLVAYIAGYAFYEAGIMAGALLCAAAAFAALVFGFSRDPGAEMNYKQKQKQQQIKRRKR